MKTSIKLIAIALSLGLLQGCDQQQAPVNQISSNIDTAYINGKIYTVSDNQPWAEAMAVKDGKFVAVGSNADINAMAGTAEVIDLQGRFVMPGLVDTHTHPFDGAVGIVDELQFDPNPTNLEDIQEQIAAYVKARPDKTFYRAASIPKGIFAGENYMRKDLDAVVDDKAVCILDGGGHSYWCNTFALEKAGIMDSGYQPPGFGVVERDEDGVPSGTVREDVVGDINKQLNHYSDEVNTKSALYVMDLFNKNGVTALRTAEGYEDQVRALNNLAEQNKITAHWAFAYDVNYFSSSYSFEERMAQIARRHEFSSEFISTDYAKVFVDSDINGYGIAMIEPFPGTDGNHGSTVITVENLNKWTEELDQKGISVQFHAFGSRSSELVADALELAAKANGGKLKTRHYPDHNGWPQASLDRLIAVNQGLVGFAPSFGYTLPGVHDSYKEFLSAEKVATIHPLRTALDKGAIIGVGTDYSSFPQIPFTLMEGVIHRRNPFVPKEESIAGGINGVEGITLEESIHAYTMGGAYALLKEDHIGSIEMGKYADFIVLDRNLFEIPVDDISETQVLNTIFNGKQVFSYANE